MIASFLVLFLACFPQSASTQTDADQVAEAKKSYGQQDWAEILRLAPPGEGHPAELDFYRGLALARLKRWDEAKAAFETGRLKAPGDKRFAEELAGIAYQQKDFRRAQSYLKQALRLDPRDSYARDFLATLYFLDGNLDATLLNWNRAGKPKVSEVKFEPQLQTNPILLDRAFSFSPLSVLRLEELRTTQARSCAVGLPRSALSDGLSRVLQFAPLGDKRDFSDPLGCAEAACGPFLVLAARAGSEMETSRLCGWEK